MKLKGKHILLGVTGSIAAYKIPELIRLLQAEGASVQVMVTPSSLEFITQLTLETISGFPVLDRLFASTDSISHITSSRRANVILIAPVTANSLAKFSFGLADDIVSTTVLAAKCPVLLAPAMNSMMWTNVLVQENKNRLLKAGYHLIPPVEGDLACGEFGNGKLAGLSLIVHEVIRACTLQDLKGKKVLISGGATREYLDPVRYLSNASSGKMAFALVLEAYCRGAEVVFVKAHGDAFNVPLPQGVQISTVSNVFEMEKAVLEVLPKVDLFVSAAAVSDFTPKEFIPNKIKKTNDQYNLDLKAAPDILANALKHKKRTFIVGFALESVDAHESGIEKFKKKSVDLLVLNNVAALSADTSKVTFISSNGFFDYPVLSKNDTARNIFDFFVKSI